MTNYAAADLLVYKDGSTTERASTSGYTATTDFDAKTGKHLAIIDLSDNTTADFWQAGSEYLVAVDAVTIDAVVTGGWIARFQIGYRDSILDTWIATLSTQTSFTLTTGPAEDDALNGMMCIIHDAASAVQFSWVIVDDYTGSTKTVTLAAGATFTVTAKDNISVMRPAPLQPTTIGRKLDVSTGGEAGVDWANVGSPTTTLNLSGTTVGTATTLTNAPPDSAGVTTLLGRITSGLFTGITSLAQWLGLLAGKQVGNSTARTEVRATGAGSGTFDETTDSQEALRDNTGTAGAGLTGITAVGAVTGAVGSVTGNVGGNVTGSVGSVASGGITTASFAAGAIDASAIATDAITAAKIAADAIGASEIAADAIGSSELAATAASEIATAVAAAILATPANLLVTDASGFVSVAALAANVITAASIAANAITAAKIATDAIDADAVAADAVTEIQSGLATASALATVQADTDDIQTRLPAALVSGRIDASVGAMAANVLTATAIAADAITAAKIAADAIGASELAADAVTEIQTGLATAAALATVAGYIDTEVAAILAAVDTEVAAIKVKTDSLTFTVSGLVDANVLDIAGSAPSATNLNRSTRTMVLGVVDTGATTTSIPTSSLDPAASVADQFKGRIVIFERDTTTAALRGQATDITANTNLGVLTVTALTTAPASGDTFVIV